MGEWKKDGLQRIAATGDPHAYPFRDEDGG